MPGNQCAVTVGFAPKTIGSSSGVLQIKDRTGVAYTATLRGMGIGPIVSLDLSSLAFGNLPVGQRSAEFMSVTLQNTGTADLKISTVAVTGDFLYRTFCGGVVVPGGFCTIDLRFNPTQVGNRVGTLTIIDDAAGSPHVVNLSGRGIASVADTAPSNLQFSSQAVGITTTLSVTVTNTGEGALTFRALAATGDFAVDNACLPRVLRQGQSCVINVTFTPTATGERLGELTITTNSLDSPKIVPLAGKGS